jgi:hypothetical protein
VFVANGVLLTVMGEWSGLPSGISTAKRSKASSFNLSLSSSEDSSSDSSGQAGSTAGLSNDDEEEKELPILTAQMSVRIFKRITPFVEQDESGNPVVAFVHSNEIEVVRIGAFPVHSKRGMHYHKVSDPGRDDMMQCSRVDVYVGDAVSGGA